MTRRWVDRAKGTDPEARAGELLRELPPAESLSPSAYRRIGVRLAELQPGRGRRWRWVLWPAPAAALALAVVLLLPRQVPREGSREARREVPREVIVPDCSGAELRSEGARIVLHGPGAARMQGERVVLLKGRLEVRGPVEIEAASARVRVGGEAVIDVRGTRVVVAAYGHSSSVEWSDGHTVEVPANSVRDSEGPAAIPAPSCQISPEARPPEPPPRPRAVKPRPKPVAPPALADEPERPVIQGSLGAEAELLAAALRHLQAGEIEAAMAAIDAHAARFPGGALAPEAARLREECLRARAR